MAWHGGQGTVAWHGTVSGHSGQGHSVVSGNALQVVTLKGGTEIQDIQIGTGRAVKTGQMASCTKHTLRTTLPHSPVFSPSPPPSLPPSLQVFVKYKGWLDHNMKVFDSNMEGSKPFRFRLGHGEVIRGWDEGLQGWSVATAVPCVWMGVDRCAAAGMKAGGRRRVVVPPRQGYGARC